MISQGSSTISLVDSDDHLKIINMDRVIVDGEDQGICRAMNTQRIALSIRYNACEQHQMDRPKATCPDYQKHR